MFRPLVVIATMCLMRIAIVQSIQTAYEAGWAQLLTDTPVMYGLSTCLDWKAITPYMEDTFKDRLVNSHATVREGYNAFVTDPCPENTLENTRLTWSSRLASLAQLWANMCSTGRGYTSTSCTTTTDFVTTNEDFRQNSLWFYNEYISAQDYMANGAVYSWNSPADYTDKCALTCQAGQDCDTYLNMVDGAVTSIGCAFTDPCHACEKVYLQTEYTFEEISYASWYAPTAVYVCVYGY